MGAAQAAQSYGLRPGWGALQPRNPATLQPRDSGGTDERRKTCRNTEAESSMRASANPPLAFRRSVGAGVTLVGGGGRGGGHMLFAQVWATVPTTLSRALPLATEAQHLHAASVS